MRTIKNFAIRIIRFCASIIAIVGYCFRLIGLVCDKFWLYIYSSYYCMVIKGADNSVLFRPFVRVFGIDNIFIGKNTVIDKHVTLYSVNKKKKPLLYIGANVDIGEYAHITTIDEIRICDNVLIGKNVTITDNSHGEITKDAITLPPKAREMYSPGPVFIENNVWIGDKVVILPNVRIGENSIIGAGSIVTKNIPKNVVACGNPAKVIKQIC